jgi:hypothetical protein
LKFLFLDESGDHNLVKIDMQYPIFVLGGIIVDESYLSILNSKVDTFKLKHFGSKDIILHTADITRNKNGFEKLKDREFREIFYNDLNLLMNELEYQVIACVIQKDQHILKYGESAIDPYLLSLNILVEKFCLDLRHNNQIGNIIAEKRDRTLDHELELSWLNLKIRGTKHLKGSEIEDNIDGLKLEHKHLNNNALQIADLIVSPIGRYVLGKQQQKDFEIIKSKFLQLSKNNENLGLIILPKK